jgi:hypothetical protein
VDGPVIPMARLEVVVFGASSMVDLLTTRNAASPIWLRLRHNAIHVPAHFDAEVLSALGWLSRGGQLRDERNVVCEHQSRPDAGNHGSA